jgi:flagellar hook protein FlgE
MLRSLYQGISGMKAMNDGLSVTGNNISNAKTTAYKAKQAQFEDLFSQQYRAASSANGNYAGKNAIEVGNGVKMGSIAVDLSQGTVFYTGRGTDVAINGNGYFVVGDKFADNKLYTRAGNFELSNDFHLVTTGGQHVLGWNINELTGQIDATASPSAIKIDLNQVSAGNETTTAVLQGNLNATNNDGDIEGATVATYDSLGVRHDVDVNYIKTGTSPNVYTYIASPANDFMKSASVDRAIFHPSEGIAGSVLKGNYTINTVAGAVPGTVDITVVDPLGTTVLTKNVNDVDQTITLDDGTNQWFTIEYKKAGAPSSASFQIAEVGTVEFDSFGQITNMTGSGAGGSAQLDFTPVTTGTPMQVDVDMWSLTGVNADSDIKLTETDGYPSAVMKGYTIGDGGVVMGYFSDGSTAAIARVAVATFSNPSGLQSKGENMFEVSANSGDPDIGISGQGDKGKVSAQSLENSNVDLAKEFVDLMLYQKGFTANTKTIRTADEVLNAVIQLVR